MIDYIKSRIATLERQLEYCEYNGIRDGAIQIEARIDELNQLLDILLSTNKQIKTL